MRKRLSKEDILMIIMIPTVLVVMVITKRYLDKNLPELETFRTDTLTIDSVAIKPPGSLHSLQTNTIYEYYIDGQQFRTAKKVKLGDTLRICYIRRVK